MNNETPPDKLTFKVAYELRPLGECPVIRVSQEAHDKVVNLANATGLPMNKIATDMIMFAAEHVSILQEES